MVTTDNRSMSPNSIMRYLEYQPQYGFNISSLSEIAIDLKDASVYTFKQGDRLDLISYMCYGDPKLWWVIGLANRDQIVNPLNIPSGTQLLIPTMDAIYTLMGSR